MTDSDELRAIKQRWVGLDENERDYHLYRFSINLLCSDFVILPNKTLAASKWKAMQSILANTAAVNLLKISGLINLLSIFAYITILYFQPGWTWSVVGCLTIYFFVMKIRINLYRSAIVKGCCESAFAFVRLWELEAFALSLRGRVYEPTGKENRWQDIALLALGWDDLITNQPKTRLEVMNKILEES